jgi:LPXTG-motif cell wall-anchored protein
MPARRAAAVLTAAALAAGPAVLLGAAPAHATGGEGKATATVLRTGLDVSLLNKAHVPLAASVNEVRAPKSANKTALTVKVDGAENGKPVHVLRADVATARATVDHSGSEGYSNLVRAKVHVPGLPLLSLIEVEQVTSKAVCKAGARPTAKSNVLGTVLVLGKKTTLSASGTTTVQVPGVGEVQLELSKTSTTSRTAAATALDLKVSVKPVKLGVGAVNGQVTLAEATCETPKGSGPTQEPSQTPSQSAEPGGNGGSEGSDEGSGSGSGSDTSPQTGSGNGSDDNLAETGGSSMTPYLAGGAAVLVAAGAGTLVLARRRRTATGGDIG